MAPRRGRAAAPRGAEVISDGAALRGLRSPQEVRDPHLKCYFMIGLPPRHARRRGHRRPSARMPSGCECPGPTATLRKLTLSVSSFVPEAVDAVPVGALRGPEEPGGQARDHQARRRAPLGARGPREPPRSGLQRCWPAGDRAFRLHRGGGAADGDWRRALREWDGDAAFYTRRLREASEDVSVGPLRGGRQEAGLLPRVGARRLGEPLVVSE